MYKPLKFFGVIGTIFCLFGTALGIRFIVYLCMGNGSGHIQSLILVAIFMLTGVISYLIGLQADIIAANRKILEDVQYHARNTDYELENIKKDLAEMKERKDSSLRSE